MENRIVVQIKQIEFQAENKKETIFSQEIKCAKGKNLLELLRENQIFPKADCGGKGTCGKCGIRLLKGNFPVTAEDKNCFSKKELAEGMRLSCMACVTENIAIEITAAAEKKFFVPDSKAEYEEKNICSNKKVSEQFLKDMIKQNADSEKNTEKNVVNSAYGIAIDIGTTTLAFALVDLKSGKIEDIYTAVNSQRAYGADVLSRVQAANEGKGELLKTLIQSDLKKGISVLLQKIQKKENVLQKIAIAGNTVMLHLLRGYSCETLGRFPFTPVNSEEERSTFFEIFGENAEEKNSVKEENKSEALKNISVTLLSCASAFIGADILAGLSVCGFAENNKTKLFLDIGTNGEMALCTKTGVFTASAAAGPAFEGGNIHCGVGSVEGAICGVGSVEKESEYVTIGEKSFVGEEREKNVNTERRGEERELECITIGNKPFVGIGSERGVQAKPIGEESEKNGSAERRGEERELEYVTIGNKPPVGICGTGVVELTAELLKRGVIDETGLLAEPYFETGYPLAVSSSGEKISFTQGDIREVQLAKAAIRAGVETLLSRAEIGYEEVNTVYLAGGFGVSLNVEKAAAIGLLPKELIQKTKTAGNTSLRGAIRFLTEKGESERMKRIKAQITEVSLANEEDFNELFLKFCGF